MKTKEWASRRGGWAVAWTVISWSIANQLHAGSFAADFAGGVPAGSALYGSAAVADGVLKLTTNGNSQTGSMVIGDLDNGEFVKAFTASFKLKIGGGSTPPADGFSFNFGPNIPDGVIGNEGSNDRGLIISFDTYDNGGGEAPAIDVFRGGFRIASYKTDVLSLIRTNDFQQVTVVVDAEGRLSLTVGGTAVFTNLRAAYVPTPGRFAFGASCGGYNDNHWVDDVNIATTPAAAGDFFCIDAEMFDTGSGGAVEAVNTMPYLGNEYAGLPATHEVDYREDANQGYENNYRTSENPNVPMLADVGVAPWTKRPGFTVSTNHRLGWTAAGEWYHYTRNIPAGHYRIVSAASQVGTGSNDIRGKFHLLVDGQGTNQPRLWELGTIAAYGSGAWAQNRFMTAKRADGSDAVIGLPGGRVTLRLAPESGDTDWFMLVPVSAPAPSADLLVRTGTSESFAGENVYQPVPSASQVADAAADPYAPTVFQVQVSNKTTEARSFTVKMLENSGADWTIGCRVDATDIKPALVSGSGHVTAALAAGASETITVELTPADTVVPGSVKALTFGVFDGSEVTTPRDSVRVEADVASLVGARQGQALSWQAPAPAGSTFTAIGLPDGLSIDPATGLVTGTPTQVGTSFGSITATHPLGVTTRGIRVVVAAPIPADGLLSAWMAEGDANDSYGSHHGTLQGGPAFVAGPLGRAFSFDGADDSIDLGSWFNLQTFTLAMWIKPHPSQVAYADIIDNNHDSWRSWVVQSNNSSTASESSWHAFGVNFGLNHDTWQHLVLISNRPGSAKAYVNGRQVATANGLGAVNYDGTQFLRIARWGGGGRYFRGLMDDVLCYDRVLSEAEVIALANSSSPTAIDSQVDLSVSPGTGGVYVGAGQYELVPSAAQTAGATCTPASPAVFHVRLHNDSPVARAFRLKPTEEAGTGWTIACRVGSVDIAPDLFGSTGYLTEILDPDAEATITVEMTPNRLVTADSVKGMVLRVYDSGSANLPRDAVKMQATAAGYRQPDLIVLRSGDPLEAGDNIYNTNAAGQQRRQRVDRGSTASYLIRLTNDGNLAERLRLQGTPAAADWTVNYIHERNYASFDGNDDHINVGGWGPGTQWTVEAWVRPSALPAGRHSIAGGFNEGRDWGITLQEGKFGVALKPISGASTLTELAPETAVIGEWAHVAGTCDGTTARLYLNGVEVASALVQVGYIGTTAGTRIGGESCCGGNGFPGLIRDVRIWNHARSATELAAAMNADLAGTETGLLGYWRMDEESGAAVTDLGPNARHGSFANGAGWLKVSEDVTAAMTGGGLLTPPVQPSNTLGRNLWVHVTPSSSVAAGASLDLLVTGSSGGDSNRKDAVRVITHASEEPAAGVPLNAVYSSNADFEFGTMFGVENTTTPDQLQISQTAVTMPYIFVPNSNEGTISKVDTRDGRELGRYRVCPASVYGNPSRTTIDQEGNCWVGNRRTGTVVKVGLLENGQWIDRNQNGVADTSRDTNQDGVITGAELLAWGEDECVLVETVLIPGKEGEFAPGAYTAGYNNDDWYPGPRSLAVDGQGNLWVGSWGLKKFHYLDGDTGAIQRTVDVASANHTPYGALIDGKGILWSSAHTGNHVLRLDPTTNAFSTVPIGSVIYGLGIDSQNHLFVSGWNSMKLHRIDVLTGGLEWTRSAANESRGVAVTADGDVWTANTGPNTVTRFSNNGTLKATIAVGSAPTGVAVDAAGKVWVVHNNDESIRRIDPSADIVDLVKNLPNTRHYGYSDMTGIVARNATTRFGSWTMVHDSKLEHSVWTTVDWTGSVPTGADMVVRVRSSDNGTLWSPWETAQDGESLVTTPPGRFLEIKVEFRAPTGGDSPVLQDITVTAEAPGQTDLAVALACLTPTPRAEHPASWQVTVSNTGTEWASNVVVTDTLPAGFEFASISIPGGSYSLATGVLTARYAGLAPGASAVFTFEGVPWTPGANQQSATVVSDLADTDPGDNTASLVTNVMALECATPPSGLLAWWPGNGSTTELVAGRDFDDWNGAKFGAGRVGQAFALDGSDDYFEVPAAGTLHSDRGFTVTGWFKVNAFHRTWQCLYYKGNPAEGTNADNREFALFLNSSGYLHFNSTPINRVGAGQLVCDSPAVVQANRWYHFATVADCETGVMEIWLDGVRVAQSAYAQSAVRTTTGPMRLGVYLNYNEAFGGSLDEVAVFGRALAGSEIMALYDVRSAGMCGASPVIASPAAPVDAVTGLAYRQELTAILGQPPYAWSIASGNLPAGLGLSAGGVITGAPQATGSSTFRVRVVDDAAQAAERDYTITVSECVPRASGMGGLWAAEGNADDSVGTSHGTAGSAISYVSGRKGLAFQFIEHSNSYVLVPNTPAMQIPSADPQFSIEAWIRPDYTVLGSKLDTIMGKRDGCGTFSYVFGVLKGYSGYVGNLYLSLPGLPGMSAVISNTIVPNDGRFHHVAATYKHNKPTDNVILWIDGQVAGSLTTAVVPAVTNEGPTIGRHNTCGYYSSCSMDEIAFHQVELSAAEIAARYQAGAAGYCEEVDADLLVKTAAEDPSAFRQDGLKEAVPPVVQVANLGVAPLATAEFEVKVQNDSTITRGFVLRAAESGVSGWTRSYQGPTGDVTAAITGSGHVTANLAPGGSEVIVVRLTPGPAAAGGGSAKVTVTAHRDATAASVRDAVRVEATCVSTCLTDMLVRRASDVSFIGDNIRNNDGTNQGKTTEIMPGESAWFSVRVANDGNVATRFRLRAAAPGGDWSMQCSGPEPALFFDGVNDAVRIPDAPELRPASLTVEGWFLASTTTGNRTLVAKGLGTQDWDSYVMWIENGTLHAGVMNDAGRLDRISFNWNSLPSGWHHVAMTFDEAGDMLRLYIDGVARGELSSPVNIAYDSHPFTIAMDTSSSSFIYPFFGQAREVRLWNLVRSAAEIQAGMNVALAGSEAGLVGLWPLTEGTGTVVNDLAGGHHGELTGGATWWFSGSVSLTGEVTSPAGWAEVVLSPGQSYDLEVALTAAPSAAPGSQCDVLFEGSNTSGSPVTTDSVRVSASVPDTPGGKPAWRVFTENDDFDQGTMVGVEYSTVSHQLQLGQTPSALPFLWVPNSNQGTISKIDTRSGRELGRYRVCPESVNGNPSRTTVDLAGNCWVGNRRTGTAVKVGLRENGGYVDRNGDGMVQTSADNNHNGVIDGTELLAWGADECVLFEVVVITGKEGTYVPGTYTGGYVNDDNTPGPRGLAVDAAGDLWLGSYGTKRYHKVNGLTGAILKTVDVSSFNHTPYGAVIDRNGILWSSGIGNNHVLRLDPATDACQLVNVGHTVYGLGLDGSGGLYVSGWQASKLSRINTANATLQWTVNGAYESRGVAVTADGDLWTANSGPGTVSRWSNTGTLKATIEVGNQPTGVAVDADGKVWVVNLGDEYVKRIDPATNAVDLAKALPTGTQHYGYSDMTGIVARNATTRSGTWTVIHDARVTGARWDKISWTALEPEGQGLTIRVRSSENGSNWSGWTTVASGASLAGVPAGRYLQIEAYFQVVATGGGEQSPVLYDLSVIPEGGQPALRIGLGGGGQFVLTGEGNPEEWILERSTGLNPAEWLEIPFTATPAPGGFTVEVGQQGPQGFFRLRHK